MELELQVITSIPVEIEEEETPEHLTAESTA